MTVFMVVFFVDSSMKEKFFGESFFRNDMFIQRPFLLIDERSLIDTTEMMKIMDQQNLVIVQHRSDADRQFLDIRRKVLQFEFLPEDSFDISMFADVDLLIAFGLLRSVSYLFLEVAKGVLDVELRTPIIIRIFGQGNQFAFVETFVFVRGDIRRESMQIHGPTGLHDELCFVFFIQCVDLTDANEDESNADSHRPVC